LVAVRCGHLNGVRAAAWGIHCQARAKDQADFDRGDLGIIQRDGRVHPARSIQWQGGGMVARRDAHGEHEFVDPVAVVQALVVVNLGDDGFAGLDVADLNGEQVGTLLFQQAGAPPLLDRFAVRSLSRLRFLDVRLDHALPNRNLVIHDGRPVRQREEIRQLNWRA